MTVCSYYLRGTCKFGDKCRNEHPKDGQRGNTFGNQQWTATTSSQSSKPAVPFSIDSMTKDFTTLQDKPLWPLSSYGPAKYQPNLISNMEESFEELRLRANTALKAGTMDEYLKYETDKIANAEQIFANARANVSQAFEQAVRQSAPVTPERPARLGSSTTPSAFGKSTFGQPSFGQTGFGQSTTPALAQSTSAFGQASQSVSAFDKPVQPTSVFGQPAQNVSVFGQPSQGSSAFIQSSQGTSAFGQLSQGTSVFGQPSGQLTPAGAFGSSAFGSGSGSGSSAGGPFSAFANQPSALATAANSANTGASSSKPAGSSVFGQSAFSNPAPSTTNPNFSSTPSAFGSNIASAFAVPAQGSMSAFGGPAFGTGVSNAPRSVFGSGVDPFSGKVSPSALAPRGPTQGLSAFGGSSSAASSSTTATSTSKVAAAMLGPADWAKAKAAAKAKPGADPYLSLLPPNYKDLIPAEARAAFESDKFEWGKIPEWVPPKEYR